MFARDGSKRAGEAEAANASGNPDSRVRRASKKTPETILAWEPNAERFARLAAVARQCGARLLRAVNPSRVRSPECSLLIIALGARATWEAASLAAIRRFKEEDVPILCYEDGARSWPLGVQCVPLAAGAGELLDSERPGFIEELTRSAREALAIRAHLREADEKIAATADDLGIIGRSAAMRSIWRVVARVSELSDVPVLLTGETGTGKELLARAIHRLDPKRRSGPFVALNCGAVNAPLAESALFGHRRGAFTGADRDHQGLFRAATGGTLFLDEIGELDLTLQVKLLRALQEGCVLGVGEVSEIAVDVRVVAATNRDLPRMISEEKFRADLFHRLNVVAVAVPPLRQRRGDVELLVEYLLVKHRGLARGGEISASPEFLEALQKLELPGNVRELENLLRQALVHKQPGTPLSLADLSAEAWRQLSSEPSRVKNEVSEGAAARSGAEQSPREALALVLAGRSDWRLSGFLDECEKSFLAAALRRTQGNQTQAARLLGLTPRSIYNKLHKHSLRFEAATSE